MSVLKNIFNRLKKDKYPEFDELFETFSIPEVVSHSAKPHEPMPIYSPYIYDSPTYNGIKSNMSIHQSSLLLYYHDLAYVASTINDSIGVGVPVKQVHVGKTAEEYNRIFGENAEFAHEHFQKNIRQSKKIDYHLYKRSILFDNMREIYPDFGKNMQDKIPPEDYELYHSNMLKLKKALLLEVHDQPFKSLSESLAEAQKKVAEITDTFEFSKACEIEDKFIISEFDKYFGMFPQASQEKQSLARKGTIKLENGAKTSTIDLANKVRNERIARLKKYEEISKLEDKSSGKSLVDPEDHSEH